MEIINENPHQHDLSKVSENNEQINEESINQIVNPQLEVSKDSSQEIKSTEDSAHLQNQSSDTINDLLGKSAVQEEFQNSSENLDLNPPSPVKEPFQIPEVEDISIEESSIANQSSNSDIAFRVVSLNETVESGEIFNFKHQNDNIITSDNAEKDLSTEPPLNNEVKDNEDKVLNELDLSSIEASTKSISSDLDLSTNQDSFLDKNSLINDDEPISYDLSTIDSEGEGATLSSFHLPPTKKPNLLEPSQISIESSESQSAEEFSKDEEQRKEDDDSLNLKTDDSSHLSQSFHSFKSSINQTGSIENLQEEESAIIKQSDEYKVDTTDQNSLIENAENKDNDSETGELNTLNIKDEQGEDMGDKESEGSGSLFESGGENPDQINDNGYQEKVSLGEEILKEYYLKLHSMCSEELTEEQRRLAGIPTKSVEPKDSGEKKYEFDILDALIGPSDKHTSSDSSLNDESVRISENEDIVNTEEVEDPNISPSLDLEIDKTFEVVDILDYSSNEWKSIEDNHGEDNSGCDPGFSSPGVMNVEKSNTFETTIQAVDEIEKETIIKNCDKVDSEIENEISREIKVTEESDVTLKPQLVSDELESQIVKDDTENNKSELKADDLPIANDSATVTTTTLNEPVKPENDDVVDVLNNGHLLKRIINPGEESLGRPKVGQLAIIALIGYVTSSNIEVERHGDLEIVVGEGDVLTGVDLCIHLMYPGEECKILINSQYGYRHFPWMFPGGVTIPPHTHLTYIVKLISYRDFYEPTSENFSKIYTICENKKNRANLFYTMDDFTSAGFLYQRALMHIQPVPNMEEFKITLKNNLAICYMRIKDYHQALEHLEDLLKQTSTNIKAFVRAAECYEVLLRFQESVDCLLKAQKLDPSNRSITKKIKIIREKIRKTNQEFSNVGRKMFNISPRESVSESAPVPTTTSSFPWGTVALCASGVALITALVIFKLKQ